MLSKASLIWSRRDFISQRQSSCRWPKFFRAQSFGNHFRRDAEFWRDARGDVVERGFIGSQPVGITGGLRGLNGGLKFCAQGIGRDEQASGKFVGLPFHPAVFDLGNGGDVIEPLGGGGRSAERRVGG